MPRSSSAVHHQRQSSDNFILDASYHGRWFHPSAFAQVRFSLSLSLSRSFASQAEYSMCLNRFLQEFGTRSSSLRKNDDDRVLTSGLLDLHSFDTELIPEVWCVFGLAYSMSGTSL